MSTQRRPRTAAPRRSLRTPGRVLGWMRKHDSSEPAPSLRTSAPWVRRTSQESETHLWIRSAIKTALKPCPPPRRRQNRHPAADSLACLPNNIAPSPAKEARPPMLGSERTSSPPRKRAERASGAASESAETASTWPQSAGREAWRKRPAGPARRPCRKALRSRRPAPKLYRLKHRPYQSAHKPRTAHPWLWPPRRMIPRAPQARLNALRRNAWRHLTIVLDSQGCRSCEAATSRATAHSGMSRDVSPALCFSSLICRSTRWRLCGTSRLRPPSAPQHPCRRRRPNTFLPGIIDLLPRPA